MKIAAEKTIKIDPNSNSSFAYSKFVLLKLGLFTNSMYVIIVCVIILSFSYSK